MPYALQVPIFRAGRGFFARGRGIEEDFDGVVVEVERREVSHYEIRFPGVAYFRASVFLAIASILYLSYFSC